MRKLVLLAVILGGVGAGHSALACGPRHETTAVEIVLVPPSNAAATQQSQTLLLEATLLETKATTEESASATLLLSARTQRKKANAIRAQAVQVSEGSQLALVVRAERLEAEAMASESASATFLARAKVMRGRATSLRTLSSHVLTHGVITTQVLARVTLPAPPAGHPDKAPLRTLEAFPKVAARPTMVAGI